MKRRSAPASSQTLARKPGYFESRLSSTSLTVAASTSTVSAPAVNLRSGVGMTTLSDMMYTPKNFFKCVQLGFDYLWRRDVQGIERFQAVACNCEDGYIRLFNAAL